jgi:hypothetical protein
MVATATRYQTNYHLVRVTQPTCAKTDTRYSHYVPDKLPSSHTYLVQGGVVWLVHVLYVWYMVAVWWLWYIFEIDIKFNTFTEKESTKTQKKN